MLYRRAFHWLLSFIQHHVSRWDETIHLYYSPATHLDGWLHSHTQYQTWFLITTVHTLLTKAEVTIIINLVTCINSCWSHPLKHYTNYKWHQLYSIGDLPNIDFELAMLQNEQIDCCLSWHDAHLGRMASLLMHVICVHQMYTAKYLQL